MSRLSTLPRQIIARKFEIRLAVFNTPLWMAPEIILTSVTEKSTFTKSLINKKQAPVKSPPNSTRGDKVLEIWIPKMGEQQRRVLKTMKGGVMENRNVYLCLRLSKTSVIVE